MTIGQNIKRIRKEKGLTQKQLGELCGMADSAIRRYENGRGNPTEKTLQRIADALNISVLNLIDGEILEDDVLALTFEPDFSKLNMRYSVEFSIPLETVSQITAGAWDYISTLDFIEIKNTRKLTPKEIYAMLDEEHRERFWKEVSGILSEFPTDSTEPSKTPTKGNAAPTAQKKPPESEITPPDGK